MGYAGNDTLSGAAGNDTMKGGAGDDTYIVDNLADVVLENANEGNDTVKLAYNNLSATAILTSANNNIENITVTGNGLFNIQGDKFGNVLIGSDSGNTIFDDNYQIFDLGEGIDRLFGGGGNDILIGGRGDNYLDGGTGADRMSGGSGKNTYIVDNIGDVIIDENGGAISIIYSSVSLMGSTLNNSTDNAGYSFDIFLTGTDNLSVAGFYNQNSQSYLSIAGNSGNNYIEGALNFTNTYDLLKGGAGNDTYIVDSDVIVELSNEGMDTAIFADYNGGSRFSGTYTIEENVENVDFSQYLSNRNIFGTGNSLDNVITGSRNVDTLNGMAGSDTLIGGEHGDVLTGGLGSDVFKFNAISEFQYTVNPLTRDVITDFNHIELDKLDFATIDANSNAAGNQEFIFIGNDMAFSNAAGQLRFVSATNSLLGDVNGDSVADFQLTLTGVTSLTVGDFVL